MTPTPIPSVPRSISIEDTQAHHLQLLNPAQPALGASPSTRPDAPALQTFNGYYTLGNAQGAFLAVDTNMVFQAGTIAPAYHVSLIISLDGTSATRYPFTGSFDGKTLHQTSDQGLTVELEFTRAGDTYGPVAFCSGSITLPKQTKVDVSGATYNNPIAAALFAGDYVDTATGKKVMRIGSDNQLQYDPGTTGNLQPVHTYAYNLNMYFFTVAQGSETVSLIMGTAAEQGFACNNMVTDGQKPAQIRSLVTIPQAAKPDFALYDLSGCELADFSGYYPFQFDIETLQSRSFVSIQAQYATLLPGTDWDLNFVAISISTDGINSQAYYFNPFTMSFKDGILDMPEQNIHLQLTRKYDPANGSLVQMSGTINGQKITGSTPFNPVPLSAFAGQPLTNRLGDRLAVNGENSVTYNGDNVKGIIYVPLMYILAYPVGNPDVVMSFGTDGAHGTACIVTTKANTPTRATTTVWAIPS